MWHDRRVAVVIPAYNEQALIRRTIEGLPAIVDRVFVVDDSSEDGTAAVAEQSGDPRVSVIRHAYNQGVGGAIVTGYRAALKDKADALVVMAGDNQMSPEDLPALLSAERSGADYVKGNRLIHRDRQAMPRLRRLGSQALSLLTQQVTGLAVDDCQCGYTVLSSRCAKRLPLEDLWPGFGYPNDLLLMLAAFGARVAEVPVKPVYAEERSGLHPGHVLSIAWRILRRRNRWRVPPTSASAL